MPCYFFDLIDHPHANDHEGMELPDLEAAKLEALRSIREMMAEDIKSGKLYLGSCIHIRNEAR